jgi:hypothetical protein
MSGNFMQGISPLPSESQPHFSELDRLLCSSNQIMIIHTKTQTPVSSKVLTAQAIEDKVHRIACSKQSSSLLLKLTRELRNNIWAGVASDNIIHISYNKFNRRKTIKPKFLFHTCSAPTGLQSLACPPRTADHKYCSTTGRSNYGAIALVCKQIRMELPNIVDTLYSQNALQFPNLGTAEAFLFYITRMIGRELRI